MDIKIILGIIAIGLTLAGYAPYIRDTLNGKTTPHAFTWFIWALACTLAFALQLNAGGGIGAYVTLTVALAAFSVFLLSLFKGEKHITKSDIAFFILALIALAAWTIAKQPLVSVILIAVTNALAFAPTIRKSWEKPSSETLFTYIINAIRQFLNFIALANYNVITALFPISQLVITMSFIILILTRRASLKNNK